MTFQTMDQIKENVPKQLLVILKDCAEYFEKWIEEWVKCEVLQGVKGTIAIGRLFFFFFFLISLILNGGIISEQVSSDILKNWKVLQTT